MIVDFQTLPETARIWIYQCNRSFSEEEILDISKKLQSFLEGWTAHGADLKAAFEFKYKRFIIIGLDHEKQKATGCSIDASVHFIQSLEETYAVTLLDKMNVTFINKNTIDHIPLKEFRKKAKKKQVSSDVIVFNNLVLNKMEYDSLWEVPASLSWHARYF
jgi:RNase H-fold protein (predicted Holliday junction resolvase)